MEQQPSTTRFLHPHLLLWAKLVFHGTEGPASLLACVCSVAPGSRRPLFSLFWAASQTPSSKSRGVEATWGWGKQKPSQQRSKDPATASEPGGSDTAVLAPTASKRWDPDPRARVLTHFPFPFKPSSSLSDLPQNTLFLVCCAVYCNYH